MSAAGCGRDNLDPPAPVDPAVLYWELRLEQRAVTLSTTAPYDTLTLVATPRNPAGEILSGLPAPTFRSTDPELVVVTAEGLLVAAQPTPLPVPVIATLVTTNLKHVDTVYVRVVDNSAPPVLGTFSIQPIPPDSAKFASRSIFGVYGYLLNRLVRATDSDGAPLTTTSVFDDPLDFVPIPVTIQDLLVSFRTSDSTIAGTEYRASDNGMGIYRMNGERPGTTTIVASTTFFGVTKVDTLAGFRVGEMVINGTLIAPTNRDPSGARAEPPVLRIGTGGAVAWELRNANVTFMDPTNVVAPMGAEPYFYAVCFLVSSCNATGNIPTSNSTSIFDLQIRVFPVPGTYEFQSTVLLPGGGTPVVVNGKVIVVDES